MNLATTLVFSSSTTTVFPCRVPSNGKIETGLLNLKIRVLRKDRGTLVEHNVMLAPFLSYVTVGVSQVLIRRDMGDTGTWGI